MVKRELFIVLGLIGIILSIANASALTSDMSDIYGSKETAIVKIEGIILEPIVDEDVSLLRGHVEVPFEYGVKQLDGETFLWFIAPEKENNYTLVVKNIASKVSGKSEKIDYMRNFSVRVNNTEYNVNPGLVSESEDFELKINSFKDSNLKISVDALKELEVDIYPGENIIKFSIFDFPPNELVLINVGKYIVPIYRLAEENGQVNVKILKFTPEKISKIITYGQSIEPYRISVSNLGNTDLKNLTIKYNKDIFVVEPESFDVLKRGENLEFDLKIKENKNKNLGVNSTLDEVIRIISDNETNSFKFNLKVVSEEEAVKEIEIAKNNLKYCSDLSGVLCSKADVCSGESVESKEGICCIGICKAPEPMSLAWIGYLIAGIILLAVAIIWLKYKKIKPVDKLEKKLKPAKKETP
ncbi:hypothetical protein COU54_01825 [Candidatus Pacearchaeota archaeon CG10_big_fil_rev_8_21_14_0_10_31_24]|nr:MAG: hypothetical protein COU54_01825 [Candidatus Pacearchaeota archaeon CG10_big_fil_rev_8_21_14_0_10_31_24]